MRRWRTSSTCQSVRYARACRAVVTDCAGYWVWRSPGKIRIKASPQNDASIQPRSTGSPLKRLHSRHHQDVVLMRDNVAVNINIAITPKTEMATSHEHSVPTSIFMCGNFVRRLQRNHQLLGVCRSVVEHDVEQR